jgi:hypothetical protein
VTDSTTLAEICNCFLREFFARADSPVFFCSLANLKEEADRFPSKDLITLELDKVEDFIRKWDVQGRALYFCINTIKKGKRRSKSNVAELLGLHADLDFKGIVEGRERIEEVLADLPCQPSCVVASGHGLHGYWWFDEVLPPTEENKARVESLLKTLAHVMASDPAVCEVARLMRLPGSHNTKNGEWLPVEVVSDGGTTYTIEALEAWLHEAEPVLTSKSAEPKAKASVDPYLAYVAEHERLDIDKLLEDLEYPGNVHNTENLIIASMLSKGEPVDDAIAYVCEQIQERIPESRKWNWNKEVRTLRQSAIGFFILDPDVLKEQPEPWPTWLANSKKINSLGASGDVPAAKSEEPAGDGQKAKPTAPVVEPIDLWGHFDPPALPRGVLPDLIERYAITMGELMGADPAGIAMAALTVCSGVIRDSIKLQVKRNSGWTEEARLWCALVGGVSSMKSPIMRAVTRPVERIDYRLWQEYQAAVAAYEAMAAEERKAEEKPKLKQLRLEDTTIEGAQDTMRNNENGMLATQDELSGWFGGLEKYSGGGRGAAKDRGFWLLAWNGGPHTVNRVARGAFRINNVGISLLGGIQPDVIREIASNTYDDGLIQRLLPAVLLPAKLGHDEPMAPVAEEYEQLIERLFNLTPDAVKGDPFSSFAYKLEGKTVLEFDRGAQVVRREMEQWHLELQKAFEVINKKLASHVGKYNGYFARLCIVFHCIEHPREVPNYISEGTAKRVAKFMQEFLFPHALSFYSGVLDLADDHETLSDIAGYILTHKPEQITNRDLARGSRKMKRLAKRDTDPVLEQLEAIGWLLPRIPGRRVTDPPRWPVNPRVHERFADRAKEEAERRSMVRAVMARLPKKVPR